MKGILTSGLIGLMLTTTAMANSPEAVSGTAKNDEQNLRLLKKNNARLEKQEESSTKAVERQQQEKYQSPGGNERSTSPIFRQTTPTKSED